MLGRNPTAQEVTNDQFTWRAGAGFQFRSEFMFRHLIGGFYAAYRARALALNAGVAECNPDRAVANQIYLDVLRRPAGADELAAAGILVAQGHAADLAMNLGESDEFLTFAVKDAYQRFMRRAATPQEVNTGVQELHGLDLNIGFPDGPSIRFFGLGPFPEEILYMQLMTSGEYCTGIPPDQPPPPLQSLRAAPISASFNLNNALLAAPAPFSSNEAAANVEVLALNQQANAQQQAISDLASTLFGNPPTSPVAQAAQHAAEAQIARAAAKAGISNQEVQQALNNLGQGNIAFAASDFSTAVKRYTLAYVHATNALR